MSDQSACLDGGRIELPSYFQKPQDEHGSRVTVIERQIRADFFFFIESISILGVIRKSLDFKMIPRAPSVGMFRILLVLFFS